ncbi:NTF2-like N-terminal transpeptidase domain-containing protein [Tomitella cavernea]|uniref:NTF2-like N-terminal transpeptidase domain-containing protein n=1 Tax=Tomitella cavernea TaxID=1387982 RepID=UPI001905267A|nr:NTF2-like N-terminal transpeptidase domain-containing protein [Tomitella cavernea]
MRRTSTVGTRGSRRRALAVLAVAAALVAGLVACADTPSSAENIVRQFTASMNSRNAASAANLTDNPAAARPVIEQMLAGLPAEDIDYSIEQVATTGGRSGNVSLEAKWDFGDGRTWRYTTDGQLTQLSIGWRLVWSPGLMVPNLGVGQTVHLGRTDAAPPTVLDAAGAPYMQEQNVHEVRLDPAKVRDPAETARRLAAALAPVAPLVTDAALTSKLADAQGKTVDVVALRDGDYAVLKSTLDSIPGVVVAEEPQLVLVNRLATSPVTSAIAARWQASRDATAGWEVTINDPDGTRHRVAGEQGPPPPDLATSVDPHVQIAARNGVVGVGPPAALVAFRPSTGQLVAVAQNNQAQQEEGIVALEQADEPGVIFQAFLDAAGVDPEDEDAVANAARQLGIGVDIPVPGLDVSTGSAGDDGVTATTYGMAVAAATISVGALPHPVLFAGDAGSPQGDPPALPGELRDKYRAMMHESVQTGALTSLKRHEGLDALTGQVVSTRPNPPSWLIGIKGDLAFAVYVASTDGASNAVIVADQFLRWLEQPPSE